MILRFAAVQIAYWVHILVTMIYFDKIFLKSIILLRLTQFCLYRELRKVICILFQLQEAKIPDSAVQTFFCQVEPFKEKHQRRLM